MIRRTLADVLAVVTTESDASWWRVMLTDAPMRLTPEGVEREMGGGVPWARLRGWRHETPADALAALIEAELLPEHWCDPERAPRWWCDRCQGNERGDDDCWDSCDSGALDAPSSHPAIVAVAALGVDTLARAEAIVAETWRARVVWRIERPHERRDRLRSRRGSQAFGLSAEEPLEVFAASEAWQVWPSGAWPEECPGGFLALSGGDGEVIRRAWPALRALAALGLHLLAVDDGRVTLGVEALP